MGTNFKKRLLSWALVLGMLLSYIPVGTVAASSTDIKAIEKPTGISIVEDYDDYYGENWLEQLQLPKTVKVTLADDTITEAMQKAVHTMTLNFLRIFLFAFLFRTFGATRSV